MDRGTPSGSPPDDRRLSPRAVWLVRAVMLIELLALLIGGALHQPIVGLPLLVVLAVITWKLSPAQRQQVLSRLSDA